MHDHVDSIITGCVSPEWRHAPTPRMGCAMPWAVPCPWAVQCPGLCNALGCAMPWAVPCPMHPPSKARVGGNTWDILDPILPSKFEEFEMHATSISDELQKVCPTRGPVTGQTPPRAKNSGNNQRGHEWVTGRTQPPEGVHFSAKSEWSGSQATAPGAGHRPHSDNYSAESE